MPARVALYYPDDVITELLVEPRSLEAVRVEYDQITPACGRLRLRRQEAFPEPLPALSHAHLKGLDLTAAALSPTGRTRVGRSC